MATAAPGEDLRLPVVRICPLDELLLSPILLGCLGVGWNLGTGGLSFFPWKQCMDLGPSDLAQASLDLTCGFLVMEPSHFTRPVGVLLPAKW